MGRKGHLIWEKDFRKGEFQVIAGHPGEDISKKLDM